ncbi:hypothetical protein SADUNF_Sadunf18G0054400 [Salix dunnii]|uniref:Uncharacterized protein n=1 Tax=Salix dunnii TaxID=1413687 RepID=A0A835MG87_9ROSI|nr:hypothetical protein SADUNF_Sadunf18G0054400 [Salix dunnii]
MLKVDMWARSEVVNGLFFLPHNSFSTQSKRGKVLTTKERNSLIFLSLLGDKLKRRTSMNAVRGLSYLPVKFLSFLSTIGLCFGVTEEPRHPIASSLFDYGLLESEKCFGDKEILA